MKLVADLHIHSHFFARATSKNLTFEHLAHWAQMKGIHVLGTGDVAHPGWLQEMQARLEPAEDGLYRLKPEYAEAVQAQVPPACRGPVRFMLGGEISNIYKRDERTRKVHNLVFAPSFAAVERLQAHLDKIGNIRSDGRPILGLDSRDLLAIVLDTDPACHLIPAHIWTPWFSALGSKSGFESIQACFGDLTSHIFAVETGLSSDPPMNWRVSSLDPYALVSNSDAHSPEKLGRETTLFECELAYTALFDALKAGSTPGFGGTTEFFPEEGKYHYDGHRACGIVWDPATTLAHQGICPVCGKEVTIGVMHRVAALADRPDGGRPARTAPFISLIPLPELLGQVYGVGAGSRQVETEYLKLLARLGPELTILRELPLEDIAAAAGGRLAEGIGSMRRGEVVAEPGYDGEYGVIRVFAGGQARVSSAQIGLFGAAPDAPPANDGKRRRPSAAVEDVSGPYDVVPIAGDIPVTANPPGAAGPPGVPPSAAQAGLFDTASGEVAPATTEPGSTATTNVPAANGMTTAHVADVYAATAAAADAGAPDVDATTAAPAENAGSTTTTDEPYAGSAPAIVVSTPGPPAATPAPGAGERDTHGTTAAAGPDAGIVPDADPAVAAGVSAAAAPLPRDEREPGSPVQATGNLDPRAARLLMGLNPEQTEAVLCTVAPLLIVAGPGTGKTRTLTVRIAHLVLQLGAAPESILAITFTNKAAEEMAQRVAGLLGPEVAGRITIKTFHAFGAQVLRAEGAPRLGLSPNFALCTDADRQELLRQVRPDLRQAEIEAALAGISVAKNRLLAPAEVSELAAEVDRPDLAAIYRDYEAALAASGALDFDDQLVRPVQLLESQPDLLVALRARYRWLSVDEYQDLNLAQYRLLRLLTGDADNTVGPASPPANLCVIGDPDQAIYGFRGADRRYFLSFQADYPGARILHLARNYRSTQVILDAAGQVIRQSRGADTGPIPTPLRCGDCGAWSSTGGQRSRGAEEQRSVDEDGVGEVGGLRALADFAEQVRLAVHVAPTDKAEAEYVVHQVEQMLGGTSYFSLDSGRAAGDETAARSFADFAVLYRLGAQSRLLIEAFERSGIPYQSVGQAPLYTQPVVRETLAYLWLLQHPSSRLHLAALLTAGKPSLPARAVDQVWQLVGQDRPLPEALAAALARTAAGPGYNAAQRARLSALAAFWRELTAAAETQPVARLIETIGRFTAGERGAAPSGPDAERLRRLGLRAVAFADRRAAFLEATTLQSETDAYDPRADRVTLMTLHAAKGLEFPVVFITGCEEGLLPYERPGAPPDIAEERRLFYVGMTRARHRLVLTSARTRFLFGQRMENRPSRFVDDIEHALKEAQARQDWAPKKPEANQLSLF